MGWVNITHRKTNHVLQTMKKINNKGLTIIELLIASMVFTTVLFLCVEGITRIAKVYVKNTSISRTNEFAKSFIGDVASQIKYGSTPPLITINVPTINLCSAGKAYLIKLNQKANNSILVKQDTNCSNYNNVTYFDSGASALTPLSARVLDFSVKENNVTSSWNISIRVAIGDDSLLVAEDGSAISTSSLYDKYSKAKCKSGLPGSEFCAVIALNTSVTRRMN